MAHTCDLSHLRFSFCKPPKAYMLPSMHLHNLLNHSTMASSCGESYIKKKMLIVKFSANIQMCVELVAQFVYHEIDNAKCAFILHRTKHLGNNNFGQFNKFQEIMVEDDICKKLQQIVVTRLNSLFFHKIALY